MGAEEATGHFPRDPRVKRGPKPEGSLARLDLFPSFCKTRKRYAAHRVCRLKRKQNAQYTAVATKQLWRTLLDAAAIGENDLLSREQSDMRLTWPVKFSVFCLSLLRRYPIYIYYFIIKCYHCTDTDRKKILCITVCKHTLLSPSFPTTQHHIQEK